MATMKILGGSGHATLTYDPEVEEEVAPVRDKFNELVGGGYVAFTVTPGARRTGERIRQFDPAAAEIIVTHPIVGG